MKIVNLRSLRRSSNSRNSVRKSWSRRRSGNRSSRVFRHRKVIRKGSTQQTAARVKKARRAIRVKRVRNNRSNRSVCRHHVPVAVSKRQSMSIRSL